MRISKKILACIFAAMMVISVMPITAFAATVNVADFESLVAEIDSAVAGTEKVIKLTDNITTSEPVEITDGKFISLNFYGKTLTYTGNDAAIIIDGGKFNVYSKSGTIKATESGAAAVKLVGSKNATGYNYSVSTSGSTNNNYYISEEGPAFVIVGDSEGYADGVNIQFANNKHINGKTAGFLVDSSVTKAGDYPAKVTISGNVGITVDSDNAAIVDETGLVDYTIKCGKFNQNISAFVYEGYAQLADGSVKALPTAAVTDITADTEYDMAYQFAANNDGTAFNDYKADFIVSVDNNVNTAEVNLFGKIGNDEWVQFPDMEAYAGYDYYMARDAFKWEPTYADICNNVGTFSCAVKGEADVETVMTVKLVIYPAGDAENYIVINEFNYTIPAKEVLPVATIESISAENLETAYKFSADAADTNSPYGDYIADFTVSFDADVQAGDVILMGKYDGFGASYDWTALDLPNMNANEEIKLLGNDSVTYNDMVNSIQDFYCGAVGVNAAGVTMTVKLNLYATVDSEPITIATKSYTFGAADMMSITVEDAVDLNIYVDDTNVDIANVRFTYNSTPDQQTNVPTTETVDAAELEDENGDIKVTVELAPAQIFDTIKVEALDENNQVVKTIETSVAEYCKAVIASDLDQDVKDLATSTLDYGKAAAEYFDYNADAFAGYDTQYTDYSYAGDIAPGSFYGSFSIDSVTYVATSVPELRFYISGINESQAAELNDSIFTNGVDAKFAKLTNGQIILQVTGINIVDFDQPISISGSGFELNYTPLRWVLAAQNVPELRDLAIAVGNYFDKSTTYFNNHN